MEERILDGDDKAREMGYPDYESWVTLFPQKRRGLLPSGLKAWNGKTVDGPAMQAHISGGRWMVQCPCGAYSYVCKRRPIHWCMVCGNGEIGAAVPVVFPDDADEIARVLLLRPVQPGYSEQPTQAAMQAVPLVPGLRRDWFPGQSVEWLAGVNQQNGVDG